MSFDKTPQNRIFGVLADGDGVSLSFFSEIKSLNNFQKLAINISKTYLKNKRKKKKKKNTRMLWLFVLLGELNKYKYMFCMKKISAFD